jgi:ribose transport system ATP-binding protein
MDEIWKIGDRISVLRDGRLVGTLAVADASESQLIEMMTGREFSALYPTLSTHLGATQLRVESMTTRNGRINGVSLEVKAGEVVGLAGLIGSGKSEIGRACYGLEEIEQGWIEIGGQRVREPTPSAMLAAGLVYIPSDRHAEGLVLPRPVRENMSLVALDQDLLQFGPFLNRRSERRLVTQIVARLGVQPPTIERPVEFYSGGNQQKIMLGRGLARDMRVFVFDEPTVGIDVGTRGEIYNFIKELCDAGCSVLLISSDLPEILHMCHRVFVVHNGQIRAEFDKAQLSETAVLEQFF